MEAPEPGEETGAVAPQKKPPGSGIPGIGFADEAFFTSEKIKTQGRVVRRVVLEHEKVFKSIP